MHRLIAAGTLVLIGCSTAPLDNISGSWTTPLAHGPFSGLSLHVVQDGRALSGTGTLTTWQYVDTTVVPGPSYAVTVTGSDDHRAVSLQFWFQVGPGTSLLSFTGSVQDAAHLRGVMNYGGDYAAGVTLSRN